MGLFGKMFGGKSGKPEALAISAEKGAIYAPVTGKVEAPVNIPDAAFASEAMGRTIAIWPEEDNVYAPISGTVTAAMPHAQGITGDDGVEVLVHVGIDTVNMHGNGFTVYSKKGDHVNAGDVLLTFDRNKVAAEGHEDIVITIVTNSEDLDKVETVARAGIKVNAGTKVIQTA